MSVTTAITLNPVSSRSVRKEISEKPLYLEYQ